MSSERVRQLLDEIPPDAWARVTARKIYFGHQSVGYDIVNGIQDLSRRDPRLSLEVVETDDPNALGRPCFAHSRNGENKKPAVKIDAFERAVDAALGGRVDVAFFKFCYVDFTPETDVDALFSQYESSMSRLRDRFPQTRFVHLTVPLVAIESGPKAWIKRVLGRELSGERGNEVRSRFNERLLSRYAGKEPVFDLASVESTYPDGSRNSYRIEGKEYPALIARYSYDGRHLNELGRQWVAAHLVKFLAGLPEKQSSTPVGSPDVGHLGG